MLAVPEQRGSRLGCGGTGCVGSERGASGRDAGASLPMLSDRLGPVRPRSAVAAVLLRPQLAAPRRAAQWRARPSCARLRVGRDDVARRTIARGRCWCAAGRARHSSGTARADSCGQPCGSARSRRRAYRPCHDGEPWRRSGRRSGAGPRRRSRLGGCSTPALPHAPRHRRAPHQAKAGPCAPGRGRSADAVL